MENSPARGYLKLSKKISIGNWPSIFWSDLMTGVKKSLVTLPCILSLTLLTASNHLLRITGPMWWISLITGLILTWTVLALALGFGSMYANFKAENQAAVLGGFGAILFLFTAIAFELLTILAAGIPAYRLVRSWRWGLHFASPIMVQTAGTLLLIALAGGLISMISLRKGMEKVADNFH